MTAFRRLVEWYLGIPAAESGQGTRWQLQWESSSASGGMLVALLAGVVLIAVAVSLLGSLRIARRRKWFLAAIRAAAVFLVAVCVLRLSLAVDRTSLPWLALMIDQSSSMQRKDVTGANGRETRLAAVQQWLTADDQGPLSRLAKSYRLKVFGFSGEAREIPLGSSPTTDGDTTAGIRGLTAEGRETRLASGLREVLDDFRGSPPAAVVVFSDGVSSQGPPERLSAAADEARNLAVPIWTVAVGSATDAIDLEIRDVLVDDVALVGDSLMFDVRLAATGVAQGSAAVQLRTPDNEVLDTSEAVFENGAASVSLRHQPPGEGRRDYVVEVVPLPEEVLRDNNRRNVSVEIRSRKLKVLCVERLPRWEFRHLKAALERDEAIELKTVLHDSDLDYTREDRTALAEPPATENDLLEYDAILLGDVDVAGLPPAMASSLARFVGERGGGLILIAGNRFNPALYGGTALEELMPVLPPGAAPLSAGTERTSESIPSVTAAGRNHPLLRLDVADGGSGEAVLPALAWVAPAGPLKAGATTLAEISADGNPPRPVLVIQRFGRGEVVWQGTDELWRWRRLREDAIYGRYWSQLIRWVSRARLSGDSKSGELRTDRQVYAPGEAVRIELQLSEAHLLARGELPQIELESSTGERRIVAMTARSDAPQMFDATVSAPAIGEYRLRWTDTAGDGGVVDGRFRVESSSAESQTAGVDAADLASASQTTRGRSLDFGQVESLLRELPRGRPVVTARAMTVPLWNRWDMGLLICLLFCLEWFVRRSSRLV